MVIMMLMIILMLCFRVFDSDWFMLGCIMSSVVIVVKIGSCVGNIYFVMSYVVIVVVVDLIICSSGECFEVWIVVGMCMFFMVVLLV